MRLTGAGRGAGVGGVALAIGLAGLAAAQPRSFDWQEVAAGVEQLDLVRVVDPSGEPAGPWRIHALRLDLARVRLDVVHAMDEAVGLETTSSIAERKGAIAAVNGGYFRTAGTFRGDSTGTLVIDGTLLSEPDRARSSVGFVRIDGATHLLFGHVTWDATVDAAGRRRALDGVNRARGDHEIVLFTSGFHPTSLTDPSGVEVVVRDGRVGEIRDQAGSTAIPEAGFVLSARGEGRQWVRDTLRVGTRVHISMTLKPTDPVTTNPWPTAEDIIGAGPTLVSDGRVHVTTEREKMLPAFATDRHPRTAIGQLPDGKALLVVVDGRQPALSVGMTLDELARLLIELGATAAINLDGGGSTAMVVQGRIVNQPSDVTGERPVSDAIIVLPRNR